MSTLWGILGTGTIAGTFADDLLRTGHRVLAVGSRTQSTASRFAARYELPRAYASYEEVVTDPDITAVYVATPNHLHFPHAMMALEAGKHVLVEKPFALNSVDGQSVIQRARSSGLVVMEGMWTRFLPNWQRIRTLLADGAIGSVQSITADISLSLPRDPENRLNNPALGGGALMDLGVYGLSLAVELLGKPHAIHASARKTKTMVDAQTSVILGFDRGQQALLHTAIDLPGPRTASITGTKGRIDVSEPWFMHSDFYLTTDTGTFFEPGRQAETYGLQYEAAEIEQLISNGQTDSTVMPHSQTLTVLETMEEILEQIGVQYPDASERAPIARIGPRQITGIPAMIDR